jgi:transposase
VSLKPAVIQPVPEGTARVAKAAFRRGNPLLSLRDELGAVFADVDFADLFPRLGQPGLAPWRLALVTLLQFRENLPDRQAAEAVRARIDWKYLLGLELTDPGFDHSVLCEFRSRLLAGSAEERLLGKLLDACQARGLLKARGRQRTDATRVLASIRVLNRLELLGETLRAALNEIATVAPDWLRAAAPRAWYERYARRVEDGRLPRAVAEREAYARVVGEDGFALLDRLDEPATPEGLGGPAGGGVPAAGSGPATSCGRTGRPRAAARGLRAEDDPPPSSGADRVTLRHRGALPLPLGTSWDRLRGPLSETCEDDGAQPDHARDDDHRHRARGQVHGRDPRGPGGKGLARPSTW